MRSNEANQYAQKLSQKELVVLYTITTPNDIVLNLTPYNQKDANNTSLKLGDIEFIEFPIEMEGTEYSSSGAGNRPKITIGNIEGGFSNVNFASRNVYDEIIGSKVTKRVTFSKYIEKFNQDFAGKSVSDINIENDLVQLKKEKYIIDRVASKNIIQVVFELASPFDLHAIKVPSKLISGGYCPFVYKGARTFKTNQKAVIGGCTWNNLVETEYVDVTGNVQTSVTVPVYMTEKDEYIVPLNNLTHFTLIDFDDPDSTPSEIIKNEYFYQEENTATQIQANGTLLENVTVRDYWQALRDEPNPQGDLHYPSDNSDLWRRVRVFDQYNPQKNYKAFTDKTRNEYVQYTVPSLVEAVQLNVDQTLSLTSTAGSQVSVNIIENDLLVTDENGLVVDRFTQDEFNNLKLYTVAGRQIKRIAYDLDDPLFGLEKVDEFVVVSKTVGEKLQYQIFTLALEDKFFAQLTDQIDEGYFSSIFQLKSISQDANKHNAVPGANNIWKDGDMCGKALTSCALRFQAQARIVDENFQVSASQLDVSSFPLALTSANPNDSNNRLFLSEELLDLIDNTGFVSFSINDLDDTKYQDAIYLNESSPDFQETGETPDITDINISSQVGDIRLQHTQDNGTEYSEIASTVLGKLHGVVVGNNNTVQYPMPFNMVNSPEPAIMTSVVFAYEKGGTGALSGIDLYYLPNDILTLENAQEIDLSNYATPDDVIANGNQVDFTTTGKTGKMNIVTNKSITTIDGTTTIPSGYSKQTDNIIYANFEVTSKGGLSERSLYIATDKQTSNPLPFGGFPGTRRFS